MEQFKETIDYINLKTNNFKPEILIVLGSGLGCFCDDLDGTRIKYAQIPNFGSSDTKGHKGELLFCEIANKKCVIMQGRFHYYDGHSMQTCTNPIKIFKMLGIKTLFLTNAAGALHKNLNVGDIMLINDHINFMGDNPLIGKNDESLGTRFPDMSDIYSDLLQKLAHNSAKELNIDLKDGVYLAVTGPSYETKAEAKAYRMLGADVAGMSSVPEAIMANYLKIQTVGFSIISNYTIGVESSNHILSHDEVLDICSVSGQKLSLLIKDMISKL